MTYKTPKGQEAIDIADEPITVGRQLGNYVTLQGDDQISRFHCVIEMRRGILGVRDLGSRNGTYVNGEKIAAKQLRSGDKVRVGRTEFLIDLGEKEKKEKEKAEAAAAAAEATDIEKMEPAESAKDLARIAGQLPDRNIRPADLTLLNARGKKAMERTEAAAGAPAEAVTLMRLILLVCFRTRASDIHVEPKADGYIVRTRVDGTMVDLAKFPRSTAIKIAQFVKVLADIDIARSNIVQEGSFACRVPDRRVDYRVSFTPGLYGQKLVIRILDAANAPQYLWDLGLSEEQFKLLDRITKRNEGMLLVCGPTGSGKSSTLYAMLRSIDHHERNVVTIEDPVEIRLDGINQMPVKEEQGNTFAALLRSTLRQDPDVVLVGEIRDNETAVTATQAANTGHLVFSTLHARDSVSAVFRLIDLDVEPYQVASGLQTVVSQRLLRLLCPVCKRARPATDAERALSGRDIKTTYDAVGCKKCLNTGFSGRKAVWEILNVTEDVRDAIIGQKDASQLYMILKGTGYRRLRESAMDVAEAGLSTIDEADRTTGG